MSDPKFTRGPLTVDPPEGYFAVRDEWGNVTAFPNPGHFSAETHKANMTLYAAAPDGYKYAETTAEVLQLLLNTYKLLKPAIKCLQ